MPNWLVAWLTSDAATLVFRLLIIGLLAFAARWALGIAAHQAERRLARTTSDPERLGRLNTLTRVGSSTVTALILLVSGLMILNAVGINIAPLLAGAGVAGLALSLGAQTLIKDFIGGILILLENQFTVGDTIRVIGVSGEVERITLRATYLRDGEGTVHLVPNGDLRIISNFTTEWARAVVDLYVDLKADRDQVQRALETAGSQTQADPAVKNDLLEAPEIHSAVGYNDWGMQVRLVARTRPGRQWAVARVLRQNAVEALAAENIRVAVPAMEGQPATVA